MLVSFEQFDIFLLFSDFPSQIASLPYFTPPEKFFPLPDEGIHLIVCVHGLDGE